jgi:large subunit ribosomal protein L10
LRERENSIELRIVKNTLAQRAFDNTGRAGAETILNEATALLFGYEEVVNPSKAISDYQRENRTEVIIRGGEMDGKVLSATEVMELATLPSHTELMAKIASGVNGPITGIATTLSNILRELASAVDARANQLEESGTVTASEN